VLLLSQAIALQPELALRYRERFPRIYPHSTIADAAAEAASCRMDRSFQAFHVVGFDVLIDAHGVPRLLEVNSKPSQSIDVEGASRVAHSPHGQSARALC
jgi:hypothetical protein